MKQNKAGLQIKRAKGKATGEVVIVSVGGSLIVPEEIDTLFLTSLRKLVFEGVKNGKRFIIITGGGRVCRKYQAAAGEISKLSSNDADWLGIDATRINARLVKTILSPLSEDYIIQSPLEKFTFKKPVIVGGGWKPGFSSDFDAVVLAKRFKAKKVVNLSNIDHVYDKDPRYNPDAKRIDKISWKDYRKLIPKKWLPGLSSPFDPIASKEADKQKLAVAIINGSKPEELNNFISGKEFIGTLIS